MKGEQIMYKYAYETVSGHLSGYGLGAGTVYCIDDYRSIIEKKSFTRLAICWICSCKTAWNWTCTGNGSDF